MGSKIADYIVENDLICCNNVTPTRVSRVTGGSITPDMTLASRNLANAIEWNTINELGYDTTSPSCSRSKMRRPKPSPQKRELQ